MIPSLLALLILVPVLVYFAARDRYRGYVGSLVGVAFGAIVSPWALGLYSFYFLSPWGLIPGMLGLVLMLIHGAPGFKVAVTLGMIPRGVVSGATSQLVIDAINGVVWASIYGAVGFAIDKINSRWKWGNANQ